MGPKSFTSSTTSPKKIHDLVTLCNFTNNTLSFTQPMSELHNKKNAFDFLDIISVVDLF